MASIAQADAEVHPNEIEQIKNHLKKHWDISDQAVDLVTEIAIDHDIIGLDLLRLCRVFYENSNSKGRTAFIKVLAELVKADDEVKPDEINRLHKIATYLRFPEGDLIPLVSQAGSDDDSNSNKSQVTTDQADKKSSEKVTETAGQDAPNRFTNI